jgi:hypothetical protein
VVITVLSPNPIVIKRTGTHAIVGTDTSKLITGSNILFNKGCMERSAPVINPNIDASEKPITKRVKLDRKCFHKIPSTKATSIKRWRIIKGEDKLLDGIQSNRTDTSQITPITRKGYMVCRID